MSHFNPITYLMMVWKWLWVSETKCINIQCDFLRSSLNDYSPSVFALSVTWEVLIFWGTSLHHSNDIHGGRVPVCVCMWEWAFRECLTFSQWAGFTQRLCHTSPIQLIAGQRLLPKRQGLLLDLCGIKYLFGKINQVILESNRDTPLLKSNPF